MFILFFSLSILPNLKGCLDEIIVCDKAVQSTTNVLKLNNLDGYKFIAYCVLFACVYIF